MNIERLLRWLDGLEVTPAMRMRERRRIAHLEDFRLDRCFSRSFPYQLGGMTGPLAYVCIRDSNLPAEQEERLLTIATEGASRIGLAYAFHPSKEAYMALFEVFLAKVLVRGDRLEGLGKRVAMMLAMAPQHIAFSPLWFQHILATVEVALVAPPENFSFPSCSLSIEPLYHQDRMCGETLTLGQHPLPIAQHTTIEAMEDILSRHIKASDRRLRPDQIKEIVIDIPYGINDDLLANHIARLAIQFPELSLPSAAWEVENQELIHQLKQKIRWESKPQLWIDHWEKNYAVLGALFRTAPRADRALWLQRNSIGRLNMLRLERNLRPNLALEEYEFCFPVSVSLYTTRGGCWKSSRIQPKGLFSPALSV